MMIRVIGQDRHLRWWLKRLVELLANLRASETEQLARNDGERRGRPTGRGVQATAGTDGLRSGSSERAVPIRTRSTETKWLTRKLTHYLIDTAACPLRSPTVARFKAEI
jgi:hypothetical protein